MKTPKIIAEIGCNHKGDMSIAYEMIKTAMSAHSRMSDIAVFII